MNIIRTIMGLAVLLAQLESLIAAEQPGEQPGKMSDVVTNFVEHSKQHPDGTIAFTIDATAWSDDYRNLPIGVFDSGIGGLTVQEAILSLDKFHNDNYSPGPDGRKDFEHERFLYFGDQANMPYGNYPSAGRQDFLQELITRRTQHHGQRPFESLIAESITVVDPAEMTARELFREIARRKLFRAPVAGEAAQKDQ